MRPLQIADFPISRLVADLLETLLASPAMSSSTASGIRKENKGICQLIAASRRDFAGDAFWAAGRTLSARSSGVACRPSSDHQAPTKRAIAEAEAQVLSKREIQDQQQEQYEREHFQPVCPYRNGTLSSIASLTVNDNNSTRPSPARHEWHSYLAGNSRSLFHGKAPILKSCAAGSVARCEFHLNKGIVQLVAITLAKPDANSLSDSLVPFPGFERRLVIVPRTQKPRVDIPRWLRATPGMGASPRAARVRPKACAPRGRTSATGAEPFLRAWWGSAAYQMRRVLVISKGNTGSPQL